MYTRRLESTQKDRDWYVWIISLLVSFRICQIPRVLVDTSVPAPLIRWILILSDSAYDSPAEAHMRRCSDFPGDSLFNRWHGETTNKQTNTHIHTRAHTHTHTHTHTQTDKHRITPDAQTYTHVQKPNPPLVLGCPVRWIKHLIHTSRCPKQTLLKAWSRCPQITCDIILICHLLDTHLQTKASVCLSVCRKSRVPFIRSASRLAGS